MLSWYVTKNASMHFSYFSILKLITPPQFALLRDNKLASPDLDAKDTWLTECSTLPDSIIESLGREDSPKCPDFMNRS